MGMEGGSEAYPFSLLALSYRAELLAPKEVVKILSSPAVVPLGGHTSEAVFLRAASVWALEWTPAPQKISCLMASSQTSSPHSTSSRTHQDQVPRSLCPLGVGCSWAPVTFCCRSGCGNTVACSHWVYAAVKVCATKSQCSVEDPPPPRPPFFF